MPVLSLGGRRIEARPGETVLEALLRRGEEVSFSCRKGVCRTCLLRANAGALPARAQAGLKPTQRALGLFLPCVCVPEGDLALARPEPGSLFVPAEVVALERLGPRIVRLRLETREPFAYRPGQFVNLRRADGLARSFSLASLPGLDRALEFHIQRSRGGRFSAWVHDELAPGAELGLDGPYGESFYTGGQAARPLLLIGAGSGLAPLYGILREALARDHQGPIALYHGAREASGLYLDRTLKDLAARFANLRYVPCVSGAGPAAGVAAGRAEDVAFAAHPDLRGHAVFIAGVAAMVEAAKKRAYLAGAALADIHADPFEKKDLRKTPRA